MTYEGAGWQAPLNRKRQTTTQLSLFVGPCSLGVFHPLEFLPSFLTLFSCVPNPRGFGPDGDSNLNSPFTQCLAMGLSTCSHLLLEEASPVMIRQATHPWSLGYPVSDAYSSRQCGAWAPSSGADLKLNQTFLGHSHKSCTNIATAK